VRDSRIATLTARDLGERVEYTWWAQRRGFVRNTLNAGTCDVILGVPAGYGMVRTTRPYYRSTYAFVTRSDRGLHITSLDDPALRTLRIGEHLIGDDYANSPAAHSWPRSTARSRDDTQRSIASLPTTGVPLVTPNDRCTQ
jgi:mxaJ protein